MSKEIERAVAVLNFYKRAYDAGWSEARQSLLAELRPLVENMLSEREKYMKDGGHDYDLHWVNCVLSDGLDELEAKLAALDKAVKE